MRELIEQGFTEVLQMYLSGDVMTAQARLEELVLELEAV